MIESLEPFASLICPLCSSSLINPIWSIQVHTTSTTLFPKRQYPTGTIFLAHGILFSLFFASFSLTRLNPSPFLNSPIQSLLLYYILMLQMSLSARLVAPARSTLRPHHCIRRPYSSSPNTSTSSNTSSSSGKDPQYRPQSRSNFKILPFLAIIGLGSGSYVFLVRSRAQQ